MTVRRAPTHSGWGTALRIALLAGMSVAACTRDPVENRESQADTPGVAGLREHMSFLAADERQGREAGTSAFEESAAYVAAAFAAAGLKPLGDDGSYLQAVEFMETRLVPGSAAIFLQRGDAVEELNFGTEFVRHGSFAASEESITAPLVFAGYGIRAPGHDDFAAIDASGRILVLLSGAPPQFGNDERAFYSSVAGKERLAQELGASGIFLVRTAADELRLPWTNYVAAVSGSDMRWLEPGGTPHESFSGLAGNAVLNDAAAQRLFRMAGQDFSQVLERHASGSSGSFELGLSATATRKSTQQQVSSSNIVGLLQGSDRLLRDEYLVYCAHLDHLGLRPGAAEDPVFNGAYDNAAGVATLLEIARAITSMPLAPRRSIIFAVFTAEEKGLLGSDYFAKNPPVPIGDIVAVINIDMPFLGFPIADVEGFGVDHSTLKQSLERASAETGLELSPDTRPELVRLIRSDQFSFVKQGVPGLNLKPGSRSSDPTIDGAAMRNQYLQEHYHRASDDLDLPYSEQGAERFLQVALLMGLIVANDDWRPQWNDGDFFGERFGRAARQAAVLPGVVVEPPEQGRH